MQVPTPWSESLCFSTATMLNRCCHKALLQVCMATQYYTTFKWLRIFSKAYAYYQGVTHHLACMSLLFTACTSNKGSTKISCTMLSALLPRDAPSWHKLTYACFFLPCSRPCSATDVKTCRCCLFSFCSRSQKVQFSRPAVSPRTRRCRCYWSLAAAGACKACACSLPQQTKA